MTDNRTTELVSRREATTLLEEFLCGYQNILLSRGINASEAVCKQNELIDEYAELIEQAIAATLGNERIAELEAENERLRKAGYEIGYHDAMKAAKRGGTLTAEQVREAVEKHWHDLPDEYDMPEETALPEYSYNWQAIADDMNAVLGSDDEYEAKMDALLCRLTNGKWSKSRAYSLDFMVSCVDEEYETLHAKELVELGSGTCEWLLEHSGTLYDKWRCSECGFLYVSSRCDAGATDFDPNYCPNCGRKVVGE